MALKYKGSKKHKRWTPGGASGTICPDWTHTVSGRHFGAMDPEVWNGWPQTDAQRLLDKSIAHEDQRYAAANGIAFCGQITGDNSWHGYPISWRDVPQSVCQALVEKGQVTDQDIRRSKRMQRSIDPKLNLKWAIEQDDQ